METFNSLFGKISAEQIVTLTSGDVAARLEDTSFMEALNAVFEKLSLEQLFTRMGGSLAARLHDPSSLTAFNGFSGLLEKYRSEQIVTLMHEAVRGSNLRPGVLCTPQGKGRASDRTRARTQHG